MHLVGALMPLIEAGRIKVYSCDNVAGRAFASRTGSLEYRCALLNRFQECVAEEVVPAIRTDCRDAHAEVVVGGRVDRRLQRGGGGLPLSVALPRGGGDERQLRPRAGVRVQG